MEGYKIYLEDYNALDNFLCGYYNPDVWCDFKQYDDQAVWNYYLYGNDGNSGNGIEYIKLLIDDINQLLSLPKDISIKKVISEATDLVDMKINHHDEEYTRQWFITLRDFMIHGIEEREKIETSKSK